jgi:hypothetical protein
MGIIPKDKNKKMKKKTSTILLLAIVAAVFVYGTFAPNAEAKKAKHNYKTANFFSVTGDQTNADGTTSATSGAYDYRYYYRKVAVPGLKITDPLTLRLFGKNANSWLSYPDGSWISKSNYSIADGYLYLQYGSGVKLTDWLYSFLYTGDYRLFSYYGGKSAKRTKRNCAQIFNVSISGDDSDEDAEIAPYSYAPSTYSYYRKIPIKNLKTTSLPDYRVYKKGTYDSDFGESWASSGISFFTDGYAWIMYGASSNGQYQDLAEGDFKICFPEKVKKAKNHSKRYIFSVSGDDSNADKEVAYYTSTYYYRKVAVPGLKIDDQFNMRLMKKANFVSGFSEEAWTGGTYYISEDGYIYVLYGQKSSYNNIFYDTGTGDYRLFVYK